MYYKLNCINDLISVILYTPNKIINFIYENVLI